MSNRARQLHMSPWQGVFHITGGGAGFLAEILATTGASRTVLEARVPYANASLAELLGGTPDQACSAATAQAMAMAALQRAMTLGASRPFGCACTASLVTDRPKQGPCRAHMAVQTATQSWHGECGAFVVADQRDAQERELTEALWELLRAALGLARLSHQLPAADADARAESSTGQREGIPLVSKSAGDTGGRAAPGTPVIASMAAQPEWRRLVEGKIDSVSTRPHNGALLLPGAFNPPHDAHRQMMRLAEAKLGLAGAFELSIENVDKPLLDYFAIHDRLERLRDPVWLTRLPRFIDKARRFPGAVFVLGIDTLIRIADPRYYGRTRERDRGIAEILERGVGFLVFGRTINGQFRGLAETALPQALADACTAVDETEFRMDLSSRMLRGGKLAR